MRGLSLLTLSTVIMVLVGCSGKRYFEPEKTESLSIKERYQSSIIDVSRDGATLQNHTYIGKSGIVPLDMGEGYRFLSENSRYLLASNVEGVLHIIDKKSKKTIRAVSLHVPIVSATIQNDLVAYILNNNTFGLYRISNNTKITESRSERTYAVDTRAASPLFVQNLVVMPMLDGKLIIVDSQDSENAKVVYISSQKVFNNVIYLARMGDTIVAATPKRLITLGVGDKQEYHANISEVATTAHAIYLFSKEGRIMKLSHGLEVKAEKRFQFAHFSVATALGSKVFALDHKGSLIVLSSDLKKHKIYAIGEAESSVFVSNGRLYKDGKIIDLQTLEYE